MFPSSSARLVCLCGDISAPGSLLTGLEIPTYAEICHCNSCRYTAGSLGVAFPALNSAPSQDIFSKLTPYKSSDILTRYFCSKCGCHCFALNHRKKQWYCLGGIIEPDSTNNTHRIPWPADTVKVSQHDFVLDTVDGGLIPHQLKLNGRSIPTWSAAPQQLPKPESFDISHSAILSLPNKSISTLPPPKAESYLPAKCHCGRVSLLIKRANYSSDSNSKNTSRYIPSNPAKYLTYLCACRSCRLSTGTSLVPWTLVPAANVFNAIAPPNNSDGNVVPVSFGHSISNADANLEPALKHYWSSPDVCRSYCGMCGATVSYRSDKRPDELDLAVGILRAEEGCMARRWLDWKWGRCSFAMECIDNEICDAWLGSEEVMKTVGG